MQITLAFGTIMKFAEHFNCSGLIIKNLLSVNFIKMCKISIEHKKKTPS